MKQNTMQRLIPTVFFFIISFWACREKSLQELLKVNAEFYPYISGYSSGMISVKSEIKIKFNFEPQGAKSLHTPITEKLFDFSPAIHGTTFWTDANTIVFKPASNLEPNKLYRAKFAIGKIIDMPAHLQSFEFHFKTLQQAAELVTEGFQASDNNEEYNLKGMIYTADYVGADTIKKALMVDMKGQTLSNIEWNHSEGNTRHQFIIKGIPRLQNQSKLNITLQKKTLGINENISREEIIPSINEFIIMKTQLVNDDEPYIQIWFSDRLKQNQDLDGLISTGNNYQDLPGWSVEGNLLRIYPGSRASESITVTLHHAIKNLNDKPLGSDQEIIVAMPDAKPSVSFVGKGVITPTDQGAVVYFKTSHLRAVDVKVLKIFENNIPQFLQESELHEGNLLNRVGRVVSKATIHLPLKNLEDRRFETTHALNLDKLIKAEPGAIYRIILSFKKDYSTYPCAGKTNNSHDLAAIEREHDESDYRYEHSYYYDEYESDYYFNEDVELFNGYDWDYQFSQRSNPCSPSFFKRSNNTAARNLLASNLALTCKMGNDRRMHIFANDILSGKPLAGVKVKVLDFQQQIIFSGVTDSDGILAKTLSRNKKPFLIAASYKKQAAYLKVNENLSLSTSNFDVNGVNLSEGIKGYLYCERGVWRPGDTMFVSFVMNEQANPLPLSYPITMEVMNPRWQTVYKGVQTKQKNQSLYSFAIPTEQDAITGNYTAKVSVGNQEFTKILKVETIMPNRLKIDVTYQGEFLRLAKDHNAISISAKWMHGSLASGLKTSVNAHVSALPLEFNHLPNYIFENSLIRHQALELSLFEGNLDEEGKVSFPVRLPEQNYPPKLNLAVNVRVFEPSGVFSVDRFNVPYLAYKKLVGLRMPQGKNYVSELDNRLSQQFDFITVDEQGRAIGDEKIHVKVFKFDYNWWWQYHEDSRSVFDGQSSDLVLDTLLTTSASGKASLHFKNKSEALGEYFIMVSNQDGHSSGRLFRLVDDEHKFLHSDQVKRNANQITFTNLKNTYKVGEKVGVNIPAPEHAWVLVCLENFRSIQRFEWIKAGKNGVNYTFQATEEMSPNIYFNATIIQPYRNRENDLPIRRYGIAPIMVENPSSHLYPVIHVPKQTRPNTNFSITVNEQEGKPMEYTIAVVDEGLLGLTRFKTPDIWSAMYAKTAHNVQTWDVYDKISGTFTGKLENVASIGGDAEGEETSVRNAKANRFRPIVRFLGPFQLSKGQKAQHQIHIPEYIGSLRVMIVAANHTGAYGSAQKEIQVRQPIMILATMPRVISPEEECTVPVSVFFDDKNIKSANVAISHNEFFHITSENRVNIRNTGETESMAYFTLKSSPKTGIGQVKVTATSGREKAVHEIEIDIRPPNPPVAFQEEHMLEAGQSVSWFKENIFISGTDKHWIEISNIPPINLNARLKYLIQYPHGCLEQTVSAAFPQLYLNDLMELSDGQKKEIDKNIQAAIKRIYKFQTASGGLSYWPGLSNDDDFSTSYAGHFLIEAASKGYMVHKSFMEKWKRYQRERAKRFAGMHNRHRTDNSAHHDDIIQAYRLYTLALNGTPEFTSMNKLRESKTLSPMAAWRLAAAYHIAGQREVASRLAGAIQGTPANAAYSWPYTYGSRERDEAIIIETLSLLDMKPLAKPLVKSLAEVLRSERWMSTQTTSYALIAIAKFYEGQQSGGNIMAHITINGKTQKIQAAKPLVHIPVEEPGKNIDLMVNNSGKGMVFVRWVSTGIPSAIETKPVQSNLTMSVEFKDFNGRKVDITKLHQSSDLVVQVTLRHPGVKGTYQNLALNAMFASGFEIANARLDESADYGEHFDYQDIRDDRVLTYFSLAPNQSKTFRFKLNATYAGKFYLPAIQCEAMYDYTVSASSAARWIEIKPLRNNLP